MNLKCAFLFLSFFIFNCALRSDAAFLVKKENKELATNNDEHSEALALSTGLPENSEGAGFSGAHNSIAHKANFFQRIRHGFRSMIGDDDDEYDPAVFAPHVAGWGLLLDLILLALFHIPLVLFYILLGLFGLGGIILGIWGIKNHTPHLIKAVSGIVLGFIVLLLAIGLAQNIGQ